MPLTSPTDASGGELNPTGVITLNSVTQGDGKSQRDGRRLTMLSVYVTGTISCAVQTIAANLTSPLGLPYTS